jgi:hypothetical protein
VTAAWSCWVNFGLTLIYQREYSGLQPIAIRAGFVGFQLDVNDALGLGPPSVRRGPKLPVVKGEEAFPTHAPHGDLFVVGDCQGLYVSTGRAWEPIEEKLPGQHQWNVSFDQALPNMRQPLWSSGADPHNILWAHWVDDDHVRFDYQWTGAPDAIAEGTAILRIDPRRVYELVVRLDPKIHYIEIWYRNRLLLQSFSDTFDTVANAQLGRQPDPTLGETRWRATIDDVTLTPLCDRLTR